MIRRIGAAMFVSLLAMTACMAGPARPAQATAAPLVPQPGYWFARTDDGNTGTAATSTVPLGAMQNGSTPPWCHSSSGTPVADTLGEQWYWDYCGGTVVSAAAEGLPAAPNGDKVVRWDKPKGDPNVWQKLNRQFDAAHWPGAAAPATNVYGSGAAPADVSGRYIWTQYIDSAHTDLATGHAWLILSAFKMNYKDTNGNYQQDPSWWFGCDDIDGPYTVSCGLASQGGVHTGAGHRIDYQTLVNGWHTYEMRVFQGDRIEMYVDGTLIDTGHNSEFPITATAYANAANTYQWLFDIGQYTSNQYHDATGAVYNESTCGGAAGCEADYQNISMRSYVDASQLLPLPVVTTPGLNASFFNNTTVTGTPVLSRVDPAINFTWGTGSPGAGVNVNNFSARWTGYVTVPTSGTYFWCTRSDDGSRVWVNGTQVVNVWTNHAASPPTCAATAQTLTAGVRYPLVMEYYDATSTATAAFGYKMTAGATDVQTPAAWLSH